ncbi:MAG TPA: DUF3488 and transglutaminase-like domain-containing protein [Steroidobacteraceae bacterium]|nr:DUF3488 and transglutaminase-like domain-containing protein [Steroidobacteraceae bacterium]
MSPRRGLEWAAGAFAAGVLLNADRVPTWVPVAALGFILWRLIAGRAPVRLPGNIVRSVLAVLLVAAVLARFRTLNGLTAGTALLILMGGIKLLETRAQRDQYIMIGASLFLLLAACLDRQTLLRAPLYALHAWLCCAALAVVASADSDHSFSNRAAVMLAARSLLYALPLGLALFVFFPRLAGAFWAIPRSSAAQTGLGDTMTPGSITALTASYAVAFRARFEGLPPPPEERYWRGPVLHEFDGYTWRRGSGTAYRPQALEYLGKAYHYDIALEPSSQRWWFSLDTAAGAPGLRAFFTYDYQLIAAEPVTEVTRYTLVSYTRTQSATELSSLARRRETLLPPDRNPRTLSLARKLRAEAGSDRAFIGAALELLRTGGFSYSLTPPALAQDSVDDFLFNTHTGFCGHYASAFVALMRAGGLPARVVTGYLGGEWNPIGRYFIVRQSDAHSWAEVWLQGRGWTRIDPTAVVEPERLRRGILDLLPDAVSAPARFVWSRPWLHGALERWDALNAWWNERIVRFSYDDQLRLLERLGFDAPGPRQLGWAFAAALMAWLLWIAWRLGRHPLPGRPDRLARCYARLCRKLAGAGVAREPSQGPLAFAAEIDRRRPDLSGVVQPLLWQYAELRFGPPVPRPGTARLMQFERAVSRLRLAPWRETARR